MLYVTTRIGEDAFTASRALAESRGPDGGFYVPMRLPRFNRDQIVELGQKTLQNLFMVNIQGITHLVVMVK